MSWLRCVLDAFACFSVGLDVKICTEEIRCTLMWMCLFSIKHTFMSVYSLHLPCVCLCVCVRVCVCVCVCVCVLLSSRCRPSSWPSNSSSSRSSSSSSNTCSTSRDRACSPSSLARPPCPCTRSPRVSSPQHASTLWG